jgi:DNA-binding XRE family transcriptional regulator
VLRNYGRKTEPPLPTADRVRSEEIDFVAVLEDHMRNVQARREVQCQSAQAPRNSRNVRPSASYVREGRPRNLRSYVQGSAVMLMVTAKDAKARRRQRIATGLRHYRKLAGFTQQKFADEAELPRERIVEYENALHAPEPDKLELFAEKLGVAPWEFEAFGAQREADEC